MAVRALRTRIAEIFHDIANGSFNIGSFNIG